VVTTEVATEVQAVRITPADLLQAEVVLVQVDLLQAEVAEVEVLALLLNQVAQEDRDSYKLSFITL